MQTYISGTLLLFFFSVTHVFTLKNAFAAVSTLNSRCNFWSSDTLCKIMSLMAWTYGFDWVFVHLNFDIKVFKVARRFFGGRSSGLDVKGLAVFSVHLLVLLRVLRVVLIGVELLRNLLLLRVVLLGSRVLLLLTKLLWLLWSNSLRLNLWRLLCLSQNLCVSCLLRRQLLLIRHRSLLLALFVSHYSSIFF